MLLAIVGMSTVTTSMFVYLEREVRTKHKIPWYLCWVACEMDTRKFRCLEFIGRLDITHLVLGEHSATVDHPEKSPRLR